MNFTHLFVKKNNIDISMSLPFDIWNIVINILGNGGYLRDLINLLDSLNLNKEIYLHFFHKELFKSRIKFDPTINRSNYLEKYNKKMIELWERTGIDDGVPVDYLLEKLTNKTRLFRTMWSHDVLKNKEQKNCVFVSIIHELRQIEQDFICKYTDFIFLDVRNTPKYKCYYYELNKKSTKYVHNYVKNFQKNIFLNKKEFTKEFVEDCVKYSI